MSPNTNVCAPFAPIHLPHTVSWNFCANQCAPHLTRSLDLQPYREASVDGVLAQPAGGRARIGALAPRLWEARSGKPEL